MIPGAEGAIEARYHGVPLRPKGPLVIIVPPHPEQEGTMDHPVIHTLFRAFASLEFNVLRFNFRGSGKSQGVFTNGEKEVADAAACLDWLQNKHSLSSQCWVAGYSFGAYVALQLLMRRPECQHFSIVSPPTNLYDFNFLSPCPAPGLIVYGENDEVVPKESVIRFAHQLSLQRRSHKIDLEGMAKASHTFEDQLPALESLVHKYVAKTLEHPGSSAAYAS